MRGLKGLLPVVAAASACQVPTEPVSLPSLEGARAVVLLVAAAGALEAHGRTVESGSATGLDLSFEVRDSEVIELAVLRYGADLVELGLPEGRIPLESTGDAFPTADQIFEGRVGERFTGWQAVDVLGGAFGGARLPPRAAQPGCKRYRARAISLPATGQVNGVIAWTPERVLVHTFGGELFGLDAAGNVELLTRLSTPAVGGFVGYDGTLWLGLRGGAVLRRRPTDSAPEMIIPPGVLPLTPVRFAGTRTEDADELYILGDEYLSQRLHLVRMFDPLGPSPVIKSVLSSTRGPYTPNGWEGRLLWAGPRHVLVVSGQPDLPSGRSVFELQGGELAEIRVRSDLPETALTEIVEWRGARLVVAMFFHGFSKPDATQIQELLGGGLVPLEMAQLAGGRVQSAVAVGEDLLLGTNDGLVLQYRRPGGFCWTAGAACPAVACGNHTWAHGASIGTSAAVLGGPRLNSDAPIYEVLLVTPEP